MEQNASKVELRPVASTASSVRVLNDEIEESMISLYSRASDVASSVPQSTHFDEDQQRTFKNSSRIKQQRQHHILQLVKFRNIGFYFPCSPIIIAFGIYALIGLSGPSRIAIDYTNCKAFGSTGSCYDIMRNLSAECKCRINFTLTENYVGKVLLSYKLTNFFGSTREYMTSVDYDQLSGNLFDKESHPYEFSKNNSKCGKGEYGRIKGKIVYPCGMLANAYFSDEFRLLNNYSREIPLRFLKSRGSEAISDDSYKFPENFTHTSPAFANHFTKPRNWAPEFYKKFWKDGGVTNLHFRAWSKSSPLPDFIHPYKYLKQSLKNCSGDGVGLCKGNYTIEINYRFNTKQFRGTKSFVLLEESSTQTGNKFVAIACLISGGIQLLLNLISIYIFIHRRIRKNTPKISITMPIMLATMAANSETEVPT